MDNVDVDVLALQLLSGCKASVRYAGPAYLSEEIDSSFDNFDSDSSLNFGEGSHDRVIKLHIRYYEKDD